MSKLKSLNYKQFALDHGEKIGLGIIGVVSLACLAITTWSSELTISPDDMEKQAKKVEEELRAKQWPEAEKAAFDPIKTAEEQELAAFLPVHDQFKKFEWLADFSPKLYKRSQPAGEVDWLPVMRLYARYGTMPMGVFEAPKDDPEKAAAEVPDREKKKPAKKGKKLSDNAAGLEAGEGGGVFGGMNGPGFGVSAGEKARGVRFNVVVGIVNMLDQQKRMQKAMGLDSTAQASQYLDYINFKIQRQRAVPGADPWAGPWKDVSVDNSIDVINEASDLDRDVIDSKYSFQTFTSPLPHRLDMDWWDPNLICHPEVPTLSEDEQDMQDQLLRAAAEVADDPEADKTARKGFAKNQKDTNRVRNAAMNQDGGRAMQEKMGKMMGSPGRGGAGGPPGMSTPGGPMGGSRGMAGGPMAGGPMAGGPMGGSRGMGAGHMAGGPMAGGSRGMAGGPMGGGGMYGTGGGNDSSANVLLFRFFDFEVEPGECYRYRVQLEVLNPSFGETFVNAPSVAEGETRTTPWSAPSTPAVVEKDANFAITRATTKSSSNRPEGAELKVVQFDAGSGTLLSDSFKVALGAFVGTVKKSLRLDIPAQRLEETEVTFSSKDILLDSASAPNLSQAAAAELKLDTKQLNALKRGGELDLAVVVNRFGELEELDATSRAELASELDKVKKEREEYEEQRSLEKKAKKDQEKEDAKPKGKGRRRRGKKDSGQNPMRMSGPGMMPGMMPGMSPGMAPGQGGTGTKGRKGG